MLNIDSVGTFLKQLKLSLKVCGKFKVNCRSLTIGENPNWSSSGISNDCQAVDTLLISFSLLMQKLVNSVENIKSCFQRLTKQQH